MGRVARGLGLRGGVPGAPPERVRALRDTHRWLARRRCCCGCHRKCTPVLGWGLLCGPWGSLVSPGAKAMGDHPTCNARHRFPGLLQQDLRALGDRDLMPASPEAPQPRASRPVGLSKNWGLCPLRSSVCLSRLKFSVQSEVVQAPAARSCQRESPRLGPEVDVLPSWREPLLSSAQELTSERLQVLQSRAQ